ncbi:MAG: SulP family inorganic anion transporter, partial [Deinococcales bacterium]|nr:SulP family inorganic anion transporter [Chitinophagaceae bacterium]
VVIGLFSGSQLSVSGPAAGLTGVVGAALIKLGGTTNAYEIFLASVVIAGIIQIIMGLVKAGVIGDYIPNSVIKGMLAAIGIILILKQFPHLIGEDIDPEGDESFLQADHKNTFTSIYYSIKYLTPSATIIGIIGISLLIFWESKFIKGIKALKLVPGALVVVIVGTLLSEAYKLYAPSFILETKHLVNLPQSKEVLFSSFRFPNFKSLNNAQVWITAVTIAIVASLETLLSIEAIDKLDPLKRVTPTNRELKAQGLGNMLSGLLGGLPITSVIVRSSANVNAGAKSKISTIFHGLFLILSVVFLPFILNKIPLSALAAILIFTGYKLANIKLIKAFFDKGWDQFVPFIVTILAILVSDLLIGIMIGICVGLFFMIRSNFRSAVFVVNDNNNYLIRLRKDVSFLNKPIVKQRLEEVPENASVIIDATRADFIDKDIIEEINNFLCHAHLKNIKVEIKKSSHKQMHLLFNNVDDPNSYIPKSTAGGH